eukprot:Skav228601  [mRNA]  locus=scaffold5678:45012:48209:+ [translate_table: standard]
MDRTPRCHEEEVMSIIQNAEEEMERGLKNLKALVAIDTLAHGVLSDLLSATGNNMDITYLKDYLGSQPLPSQPLGDIADQLHRTMAPAPRVTFVEVSAMVNRAAQQVVIGWSERSLAWRAGVTWEVPTG